MNYSSFLVMLYMRNLFRGSFQEGIDDRQSELPGADSGRRRRARTAGFCYFLLLKKLGAYLLEGARFPLFVC